MKGSDVKCPKCSKGLRDVAPDYPLTRNPEESFMSSLSTFATCEDGHRIVITDHDDDAPPTVELMVPLAAGGTKEER